MSYLICIDPRANQILHPEILKLCDSFIALDEKEMMYVVLYTDYNSIYKQLPEHERKRRAMWHAFNENEHDVVESLRIKNAIEDYMSLQYNPKIDLINRYQKKIDALLDHLDADDSPTSIGKTTSAIASLRENIKALQNEVDEQNRADGVIKGDRQLSFLEKVLSNKKQYKAIIAKK